MSKQYINGQLMFDTDYSTSEVKTGATWINGKPLYRKVVSITTQSSAGGAFTNITDVFNAENAHVVGGWIKGSDGYNHSINSTWSTSSLFTFTDVKDDATVVYMTVNQSNLLSRNAYIIIEYTKTTD